MEERENVNSTGEMLGKYQDYLRDEERSLTTIGKYVRDMGRPMRHLGDGELSRESVREYKQELRETYKITSANSMLAAVNGFLAFAGCGERKVKLFKIQKVQYSWPEREITGGEYGRLVYTARRQEGEQMSVLLQTIGSTGIRTSELKFITAEPLEDERAEICSKRKYRVVLFPEELTRLLKKHCRKVGIVAGSVFISRRGNLVDRSSMSKKMRQLGREAGVDAEKVFPHNLQHLSTRTSYSIKKDVVWLMDLLGYSSIDMTRIYTMTTKERPRRQISWMRLILRQNGFTAKEITPHNVNYTVKKIWTEGKSLLDIVYYTHSRRACKIRDVEKWKSSFVDTQIYTRWSPTGMAVVFLR